MPIDAVRTDFGATRKPVMHNAPIARRHRLQEQFVDASRVLISRRTVLTSRLPSTLNRIAAPGVIPTILWTGGAALWLAE